MAGEKIGLESADDSKRQVIAWAFFRAQGFLTQDADGLTQEMFLWLRRKADRTHPISDGRQVRKIVSDVATSWLRKEARRRRTPVVPGSESPASNFALHSVWAWAEELPPLTYQCLLLGLQGFRQSEIAASLGISESTVSAHFKRIKQGLQELVEVNLETEIDSAYEAIANLSNLPATPERDAQVEQTIARLRELQHREAERFRKQFEDHLMMPLNAGASILGRSRNLRKQLEDLAAADSSNEEASSA